MIVHSKANIHVPDQVWGYLQVIVYLKFVGLLGPDSGF